MTINKSLSMLTSLLEDCKSSIKLDFLTQNITYVATIYGDDCSGSISKRDKKGKKRDDFYFYVKASGGQAIIIRPIEDR